MSEINGIKKIQDGPKKESDGWTVLGTVLGFCLGIAAVMTTIWYGTFLFG